jgi:hypothetical protein
MSVILEKALTHLNTSDGFFTVFGCDPGPEHSALVHTSIVRDVMGRKRAHLVGAWYPENKDLAGLMKEVLHPGSMWRRSYAFLAIEKCGQQGCSPGESVFETAAMYGEIRQLFRPIPTYALRSSEWRHALTGVGNANTPAVYEAVKQFFDPTGRGADAYKGTKAKPGPLWGLHEAGKGGNVEHLKDALGAALGLTMIRFRSGVDPEAYRREW